MSRHVTFETGTKLPCLEGFYRVILSWDFYREIADDRSVSKTEQERVLRKGLRSAAAGVHDSLGGSSGNSDSLADPSSSYSISKIPTRFKSEDDYVNRFYPLFLIEAKQMISRSKEVEMSPAEFVIQLAAEPRDGFIYLTLQRSGLSGAESVFNADLCLLFINELDENSGKEAATAANPPASAAGDKQTEAGAEVGQGQDNRATALALGKRRQPRSEDTAAIPGDPRKEHVTHTLAIVESTVRNLIIVKLVIPVVDPEDVHTVTRLKTVAQAINTVGKKWSFVRVMGLSTITREYQALMSFPDFLLKDDLLQSGTDPIAEALDRLRAVEEQKKRVMSLPLSARKAQMKRLLAMESKRRRRLESLRQVEEGRTKTRLEIPVQLQRTLEGLYNVSQMEALQDCLKTSGITLIQGPPGTGKTTTIVGVLSVILNASLKTPTGLDEATTRAAATGEKGRTVTDDGIAFCSAENENEENLEETQLAAAQPWVTQSNYECWYDKVQLVSEDLEKFTELHAERTDAVLELSHVTLDAQPRRILVCAPSNAAIDEILKRLTRDPEQGGGILDAGGERYTPAVVRVGPNVHPDLTAYSLETRTAARVRAMGTTSAAARDGIKANILSECSIVCCTLSICGSRELVAFPEEFDTVVIDEASQGVELSTLIPLRLGCRRLILVGDPRQLPATVFSRLAIQENYDQSLFQRLERAGHKVNMLSVQYRMHPKISRFPSLTFYDDQLKDAPGIENFVKPPIPWYSIPLLRPVVFYALDSQETTECTSLINAEEAMFICQLVELVQLMLTHVPGYETAWYSKIAVISPYAEQVRLIRRLLKLLLQVGVNNPCPIDVNTVDGFQGREKDFIIFSAVRAQHMEGAEEDNGGHKANVGFLADIRRMNVALTRARCNLWIVGNARYLVGNPQWGDFWHYTAQNDFQFNVKYDNEAGLVKNGFLKRWLSQYLKRVPSAKTLLLEHVPKFVEELDRDVQHLILQDKLHTADTQEQLLEQHAKDAAAHTPLRSLDAAPIVDDGDVEQYNEITADKEEIQVLS